jgi:hypothetical protein
VAVAEERTPFEDVRVDEDGFSIPELKWRELLFVGALRREGDAYVRDPTRPLPPFRVPDLFPDGVRLTARIEKGRVFVRRFS